MEEIRSDRIARLVLGRLVLALVLMAVISIGAAVLRKPDRQASAEAAVQPMSATERSGAVAATTQATVRVSSLGCGTAIIGSGFVFEDVSTGHRQLVTNSHLVDGGAAVEVDRLDGSGQPVRDRLAVIADKPGWDLALVEPAGAPPLRLRESVPVAGEPVLLIGYGGGRELSVIDAFVQSVVDGRAYGAEGSVVLVDRITSVGFSGGPVVDRNGEVVAVLRSLDPVTGLSIAVPTANIVQLAERTANDIEDRDCK